MTHEEQIVHAVKKVMPAVVSITAAKDLAVFQQAARQLAPLGYPIPEELLRPGSQQNAEGILPTTEDGKIRLGGGSGFIVDKSGIILTNRHVVIDPEADYTIVTHDEKTYPVRIVARDLIHDIAILKVDAKEHALDLPIVSLSNEENLDLGQTVIAIGNALGEFKNTVSTGVISGLSRFISAVTDMSGHQERLRGLIQTDAAINPGNSGGPLIDSKGEVIGVNVAIVFGAQNIGFAVPIKKARRDLDDIKQFNRIRRPFLGVRYVLINKALAERFKLPQEHGALVLKEAIPGDHAVIPGSPADKSGIQEGDIIMTCNGHPVNEHESLEDMLEAFTVGETITLDVLRDGKERVAARVTLEERV